MHKKNKKLHSKKKARGGILVHLSWETRRSIAVVFIFTLALLFILSLFGLAGEVGATISVGLHWIFGWGSWLFPAVLILIALFILRGSEDGFKIYSYLGLGVLVLGYSSLFYLIDAGLNETGEGVLGGGNFGALLGSPLKESLGGLAGTLIVLAIILISALLIFETSVEKSLRRIKNWLNLLLHRQDSADLEDFNIREISNHQENSFEEDFDENDENEKRVLPIGTGVSKNKIASAPQNNGLEIVTKSRSTKRITIPIDLLEKNTAKAASGGNTDLNKQTIRKTLDNFGIHAEMGEISVGPTVTQYTLRPAQGVKLSQITTLQNDLSLALAAHPLRIEAPIPGKSLVGIEVPNESSTMVTLREVLESQIFQNRKSNLALALGKDVAGNPYISYLDRMPHLLVAGATGSGKTVCLNSIIINLLFQNSFQDLKFIFIDPKRVELTGYEGIPHLLTPVIVDAQKTVNALKWAVKEMENRFETLAKAGKRDIKGYNEVMEEKMPYIVIIIDELADLMTVAAADIETCIIRLAQMARAVGIHLIIATQRPSVNVITGLIKANISARIAFSVASSMDSRTILDATGAEKLLGNGDMLHKTAEMSSPVRLQGAYVSDKSIEAVVDYLREQAEPEYVSDMSGKSSNFAGESFDGGSEEEDELIPQAKEIIWQAGKASASLLQRRLKVGYARAARLLDILEANGFIGPSDGAKPREILITQDMVGSVATADLDNNYVDDEGPIGDEEEKS